MLKIENDSAIFQFCEPALLRRRTGCAWNREPSKILQNPAKILVSSAAIIWVVTQRLVGVKRDNGCGGD